MDNHLTPLLVDCSLKKELFCGFPYSIWENLNAVKGNLLSFIQSINDVLITDAVGNKYILCLENTPIDWFIGKCIYIDWLENALTDWLIE